MAADLAIRGQVAYLLAAPGAERFIGEAGALSKPEQTAVRAGIEPVRPDHVGPRSLYQPPQMWHSAQSPSVWRTLGSP